MNRLCKAIGILLTAGLAAALGGCGASGGLAPMAQAFGEQRSVVCTIQYSVAFDAVIGGAEIDELRQDFVADAEVDLEGGGCHLLGTMETLVDGTLAGTTEVESYGGSDASYYRYGSVYYSDTDANSFLTIINAPLTLNLSDGSYTKENSAQILYGSACDVYKGTEIADDSDQRFVSGLVEGSVSLEGCVIDVTLRVYQDTSLPANLELNYSNLEEMDITFSDAAGNQYTITDLSYQVIYSGYGTEPSVEAPEEFKDAALNGGLRSDADGLTDLPALVEELPQPPEPAESDGGGDVTYLIRSSDGVSCCEIATPEYMSLDERHDDSVSFYYYYAEDDYEIIEYTVYSDFTNEDELAYAETLPDFYRENDQISNVSASGVQSITIGDYEVRYNVIYLTLEQDGISYDLIDVYSWVPLPNGRDCLEVDITEFNGSGDGQFIDAAGELEYAYQAIVGGFQS